MVCVLQSKLPRSSAVFQLYCLPFLFPLKKKPRILHLLLLGRSSNAASFGRKNICVFVCFYESISLSFGFLGGGFSLFLYGEEAFHLSDAGRCQ